MDVLSNVDVTVTFLRHPDSRIFHIHIQPGAPPPHLLPPINSQKSAKSAGSISQAIRCCHASQISTRLGSPYGPCSHTFPRIPIQPSSSKNLDIGFDGTSVSGPANQAPAGLHEFPAPTAGAVSHVRAGHQIRRDQRPAYPDPRIQPAYSNSTVQPLGGMGMASTTTPRRRRRQGEQHLRYSPA